ncbi:hypothetical protein QYM36_009978 [Artemia franciscana]|uniref:Liprin-beta-1/2 coiled-coil domain-containing protein n=1 Tax=Artemia franciscana TaxID=6661 RepID=A0AA88HVZ2_ARTSF|nr:hypothetical protein QYM36_009978 [Artemia franciscana]
MDECGNRKPPSGRSPNRRKLESSRTCEELSDSESDSGQTSRSHQNRHRRHKKCSENEPCGSGACARRSRLRKHDMRSAASSPGSCGRNHSSCSDRDLHDWSSCSASRDGEFISGWYSDWRPHTPYGFVGPMGPAVPPYWYPKGDMGYTTPPAYWRPVYKPEVEERLRRVEGEKDSLQLQVSVLMEQIEAQSDKIAEMEKCMQDKSTQLKRTEEILQKELMIRSQLETQKMELTKELSSLRLRSVSMEKENLLLRAGAQISALESPEPKSPSAYPRVGSPDAASTPMSVKDSFHIQRSPSRGLGGSMDTPTMNIVNVMDGH